MPKPPFLLRDIPVDRHPNIVDNALQRTRSLQSELRSTGRSIEWKDERIRTYRVEIMKKYSIAVACVVFIFIGAPLGLSIRRGSLGVSAAFAMGIFLFYWITLVQGEKLADRAIIRSVVRHVDRQHDHVGRWHMARCVHRHGSARHPATAHAAVDLAPFPVVGR